VLQRGEYDENFLTNPEELLGWQQALECWKGGPLEVSSFVAARFAKSLR
jgi:hypothetical protein